MPVKHRDGNDCLSYCVGYILGIKPKDVPFFAGRKNWYKSLNKWLEPKGYKAHYEYNIGKAVKKYRSLKKPVIAVGVSPRSKCDGCKGGVKYDSRATLHAIVSKTGKFIYDPSPANNFIKGKPVYYINIIKIKKYAEK